jgi:hypothetical protein
MTAPPLITQTSAEDISARVEQTLQQHWDRNWQPDLDHMGGAFVDLYGRLAELVIDRLNKSPDNHMLAFLNMAGVDLLPPQAATTEVAFFLGDDGPDHVEVPKGTQIATVRSDTRPEIIFETVEKMMVTRNALTACWAVDAIHKSDHRAIATGERIGCFDPFAGATTRERYLFLGDDQFFSFADAAGAKDAAGGEAAGSGAAASEDGAAGAEDSASREAAAITLKFDFATPGDPATDGWSLDWRYWNGKYWVVFGDGSVEDTTDRFRRNGSVVFRRLPAMKPTVVNGQKSIWIRCGLTDGTGRSHLPIIRAITGSREIDITGAGSEPVRVDTLFNGAIGGAVFAELKPEVEFFPLGQSPGRMDAFYMRSDHAFTKHGATIKLTFDLVGKADAPAPPVQLDELGSLTLAWDCFTGKGWQPLGESRWRKSGKAQDNRPETLVFSFQSAGLNFLDGTRALTESGVIQFTLPAQGDPAVFAKTKVNGVEGYWLRAKLLSGSYSEPGYLGEKRDWVPPKNYAPYVTDLAVHCEGYKASLPERRLGFCSSQVDGQGQNHFAKPLAAGRAQVVVVSDDSPIAVVLDASGSVGSSGHKVAKYQWRLDKGAGGDGKTQAAAATGSFAPFSSEADQRGLYLGLQAAFPAGEWIRLLLDVEEARQDRLVTWGYWNGTAWQSLQAVDKSEHLSQRGYLGFFAPPDHKPLALFGTEAFWLRAVPGELAQDSTENTQGAAPQAPQLKTVRLNIVQARNATTIGDEVLGSSNGKERQRFRLARHPVLNDIELEVCEPDTPSPDVLRQLQTELGLDDDVAKTLTRSAVAGEPGQGVWVRWRRVTDFHGMDMGSDSEGVSKDTSRHFVVDSDPDAKTSHVRFGDGRHGRIPAVGYNNIRVVSYRTHDGQDGNVPAGAITVLRNPSGALAAIKRVVNWEPAVGGAPPEKTEEVRERGPRTLRHRQRAVAAEDFRWLAEGVRSEVAHAWCLPTRDSDGQRFPGYVTVLIAPIGDDPRPVPPPSLLRKVSDDLKKRAATGLIDAGRITVKAPQYVEVTVTATVVAKEPSNADKVVHDVTRRLDDFLHPLRGGPTGAGWIFFDRPVFPSEVYAVIQAVPGVDHVASLQLEGSIQRWTLRLDPGSKALFDLHAGSQASTFDERIKLGLARAFSQNDPLVDLPVYGFSVGDEIRLVAANNKPVPGAPVFEGLTIGKLDNAQDCIMFAESIQMPDEWKKPAQPGNCTAPMRPVAAVLSTDGRLRLPIAGWCKGDGETAVMGVRVCRFQKADLLSLVAGSRRQDRLRFASDSASQAPAPASGDCIPVPEGYLVCSGRHDIRKASS